MRLIDADALLDKVKDYGEGQERLLLIDPYWVRKAPTIEIPQWIPCTDRLPEKTGYYLVSDRRGDVYSTNFDYLRGEMCFGYDDLDGCFIKDDTVIAWMPLPAPYRKEGDTNDQL